MKTIPKDKDAEWDPILQHIIDYIKINPHHYWDAAYDPGPPKKYIGLVLYNGQITEHTGAHKPVLDLTIGSENISIYYNYGNLYAEDFCKILLADPNLFDEIQKLLDEFS